MRNLEGLAHDSQTRRLWKTKHCFKAYALLCERVLAQTVEEETNSGGKLRSAVL